VAQGPYQRAACHGNRHRRQALDSVTAPSAQARAQGIKIFTIGVGGTYNLQSLQNMASQPYSDYVYGLKDFDLKQISKKLIDIACNRTTTEEHTELRPAEVATAAADLADEVEFTKGGIKLN
jgi:hypothetical protein